MTISKVIENITEKGVRFLKIFRFGKSDIIKCYMMSQFGDDFNIPSGYKALFIKTSNSAEPICLGFINKIIFDTLNAGEKQIFSTNKAGGSVSFYLKLTNDGKININGTADFATGFTKLKEGFDKLKSDFNGFLTHVHGASGTPPVPPATPSTASIDLCKKNNILIE